jgi:hypothetical protein
MREVSNRFAVYTKPETALVPQFYLPIIERIEDSGIESGHGITLSDAGSVKGRFG